MSFVDRFVVDTGVLVSAALWPKTVPAEALALAFRTGSLWVSGETLAELSEVLQRSKFERYLALTKRIAFYNDFAQNTRFLSVHSVVHDCQDLKDNKFLALALDCQAGVLISSDAHLTSLTPWRGVAVVTPAQFIGLAGGAA